MVFLMVIINEIYLPSEVVKLWYQQLIWKNRVHILNTPCCYQFIDIISNISVALDPVLGATNLLSGYWIIFVDIFLLNPS